MTSTDRSLIRVGTRSSQLALIQTRLVIDRLRILARGTEFEEQTIITAGDRTASEIRGDGVFVKEIQRSLLDGEIDIAVHSLKDLPTEPVEGLVIGAIPVREDPSEALVGGTLATLSKGARVGTSSPRRAAQLRALRPDLDLQSIRGNVPTRVEKVQKGQYDAALLANAGLKRLGLEADEVIPPVKILPAPGQGALAVEVRADDEKLGALLGKIDDHHVRAAVSAEREVLRNLGGGCLLPVGTFGRILEGSLVLDAAVAASDGSKVVRASYGGPIVERSDIAMEVSNQLRSQGAMALLDGEVLS